MVNQDIVKYLEEGKKRGFSIQLLKKKLLEGGFQERDIDEAISAMAIPADQSAGKINLFDKSQDSRYTFNHPAEQKMPFGQAQQQRQLPGQQMSPQQTQTSMNEPSKIQPINVQPAVQPMTGIQQKQEIQLGNTKSGEKKDQVKSGQEGKWMSVGAILGIVILVLTLTSVGLSFFAKELFSSLLGNNLLVLIVMIVIVLMTSLYYYAFVRVGKKTNERLLSLGAWFVIVPTIVYLALLVVAGVFVYQQALDFFSGAGAADGSYKITFLILSILWVVVMLIHVIGMILTAVGMIKAGKEVSILKIAGILGIAGFICGLGFLVGMVLLIYSILNAFSTAGAGTNLEPLISTTPTLIAMWSFYGVVGLKQIARIFEIIGLFKASKKFE
ncbi:MAG: hypothetical protein KKD18_01390 [Nanoarchaeota archaeon]|nr:hypothetical protein [Nanoarchaeota archaeon]MBU0977047.1 hypothetical protein [Nanoarchaeota archaeon]